MFHRQSEAARVSAEQHSTKESVKQVQSNVGAGGNVRCALSHMEVKQGNYAHS